MAVLETLKLLSKGDISDEQLEVYEEDGNRIRAYAAVARHRALTSEEQSMVDEIGARLAEEARKLVDEDVHSAQTKRGELESLAAIHQNFEHDLAAATAGAIAEEQKRLDAISEAKNAEGDVNNFETLSSIIPPQIAALEDELKRNLPGTPGKHKAKIKLLKEDQIQKLMDEKLDLDNLALAAAVNQAKFERLRDEAEAARDNFSAQVPNREADALAAGAALDLGRATPRVINSRFSVKTSKASNQAQLIASAVQISQASPAPADVKYDAELALMKTKHGPIEQFIKFNLGHNTSDKKKFHPNPRLLLEWADFVRNNPQLNLSISPPWLLQKGRQKKS
jgi:hypothetical protein